VHAGEAEAARGGGAEPQLLPRVVGGVDVRGIAGELGQVRRLAAASSDTSWAPRSCTVQRPARNDGLASS
jgi:hypothetical protein